MREIKFRGKRTDNGEWVEGFLIGLYNPQIKENVIKQSFIHNGTIFYNPDKVTPETVGQFTGLTDKNGKEIYEGDIVQIFYDIEFSREEFYTGVVEYKVENNYPAFDLEPWIDCDMNALSWLKSESDESVLNYEVIGNIHDNPELLK